MKTITSYGRPRVTRLPRSVLRTVPTAVRVVVLDNAGLLFDDVSAGARARHRRAQKHVDDEHDEEHEPERYAQVQQPRRPDTAVRRVVAEREATGRLSGFQHEHGRAGRQRAVLRLRISRERVSHLQRCKRTVSYESRRLFDYLYLFSAQKVTAHRKKKLLNNGVRRIC